MPATKPVLLFPPTDLVMIAVMYLKVLSINVAFPWHILSHEHSVVRQTISCQSQSFTEMLFMHLFSPFKCM